EAYRLPWLHAQLCLWGIGMLIMTVHVARGGGGTLAALATTAGLALLAALLNWERPHARWAALTLVAFLEFTICTLRLAARGTAVSPHEYGLLFVFDSLAALAFSEAIGFRLRWLELKPVSGRGEISVDARWADAFLSATPRFVIVLTALADWTSL